MTPQAYPFAHGRAAVALPEGGSALPSRISWSTVVAGGIIAAAIQASPEALLQRAQDTLRGTDIGPAARTTEQRAAEIASLHARCTGNGSFAGRERERLNAPDAADAPVPEPEAVRRVRSVEEQAQRSTTETMQRARAAADATARATSAGAVGAFADLLPDTLALALGAQCGTRDWMALRAATSGLIPCIS